MSKDNKNMGRRVVYCLKCWKPSQTIATHLTRVCMKTNSPEERQQELQRAKESTKAWTQEGRIWDYTQICDLCPHGPSRRAFLEELKRRGFFILNSPMDIDIAEAEEQTHPAVGEQPSTSAENLPPAEDNTNLIQDSEPEGGSSRGPTWQRSTPRSSTSRKTTLYSGQKVLREAKKNVLDIYRRLLSHETVTEKEKRQYRYYCEAILLLRHYQRPAVVEGLTVIDWLQKQNCNGRVVVFLNRLDAAFALTQKDAALIDQYYLSIRSDCREEDVMDNDADGHDQLFVGRKGRPIKSATNDLRRLHEQYKLKNITSQEIRQAMKKRAANGPLTDELKTDLAYYLGDSDEDAEDHYGMRDPENIMKTTNISLSTGSSDQSESKESRPASKRAREAPDEEDFDEFQLVFPVTLDGKPPSKVSRTGAGFSAGRVLCERWRALQFRMREKKLLEKWTRRPPTIKNINRIIQKEQWYSNCPAAETIIRMWSPPEKEDVESSEELMKLVHTQKWKHLAVVEPSPRTGVGKGVVTTKRFLKNSILCDFHGELISAAEGRSRMASRSNETAHSFFFKAGTADLCVDAHHVPCSCHPHMDTFGRLINSSKRDPNVRPVNCFMQFPEGSQHVIFFRAMRDLEVDEELLFDYGLRKNSFRGEGALLTWLED